MAAQEHNGVQRIFLAHDRRLNLFWRVLLYEIAYFVLMVFCLLLGVLAAVAIRGEIGTVVGELLFSATFVSLTIVLTYQFRRSIDRRSWRGMALTSFKAGWPQLLLGLLLGTATIGLVFVIEYALGWVQVVGTGIASDGLAGTAFFLLVGLFGGSALAPGFTEELAFRGYPFQNMGERFPLWLATVITGLLFGVFHIIPAFKNGFNLPFVLGFLVTAFLVNVLLVLFRLRTGVLWLAIGWHIAFDWGETNIFGLNLSKHSLVHVKIIGPAFMTGGEPFVTESGLVTMIVLVLAIALAYLWIRQSKQRLDWQARLNGEGQVQTDPVSEVSALSSFR